MESKDIFNVATIEIFRLCLEEFPSEVELDHKKIAREVGEFFPEPTDEVKLFQHLGLLNQKVQDTISWLTHEGYIRVKTNYVSQPSWYVVTPKGLQAASVTIDSLESKPTFADVIKGGVKEVTSAAVPAIIGAFLK
ncbi:hypothetical protein LZP69_10650 [Shewanella sp. AS1]|uniref:hypothetical protein n=1 Tax=Shewanella sp. AS1 TaxID=2907626 RepID=UPI001F3FC658|nr:hypothetical protein [Shewanella sp. AS1]MCE9679619.1 hypothetical protein [Shewanella sp. AS1]